MAFTWISRSVIYYTNIHLPLVMDKIKYRFRYSTVIYGLRCNVNNMVYVGSTTKPADRFYQHTIEGKGSNKPLQADIAKYGLDKFTLYIFEIVVYPAGLTTSQQNTHLKALEQSFMDRFPAPQLYNSIRSYSIKSPYSISSPSYLQGLSKGTLDKPCKVTY